MKKCPYLGMVSLFVVSSWVTCDLRIITLFAVLLSLLGILVKLASISSTSFDWWHIRCINVLLDQSLPGDLGKPRVVLDILTTTMEIAQSLGQVCCNELHKQILSIVVDVWRIFDSALEDVLVDLDRRATVPEWCEAAQHLKDQDTKRPPNEYQRPVKERRKFETSPIDRFVVSLRCHDLRGEVVWCSAKRPGDVWYVFGKAKIGDLDVAMPVEQQILRLQISVDDVLAMQVLYC